MDYMYLQDLANVTKLTICGNQSDLVKFRLNEEDNLDIKEKDTANLALSEIIQDIELKVSKLEIKKDELHQMVLEKIRKHDKQGAKPYLIRKKMIEKKIEELNGSRNKCEEQLLTIESSTDKVAIYHALKEATITQENQRLDIDQVEDLMERNKDIYIEQQEISNILSAQDPIDQAELLDELDKLDVCDINIENPPVHKLPVKRLPVNLIEEFKEPQRKNNIEINWA